ncbi:MAG TPA: urease accessory protein UreD [Stellaceae bacterium]|nr:urease accessory protein UreD [Stellaceae bacterium]
MSTLADLDQHSPCRALFPRPPAAAPPLAVLVNTAGGLAGGDTIAVSVSVAADASATVTSQAAEKIYRSLGPHARVETRLDVGERAFLEWLPQETILFDGACLDRSVRANVAAGGRLLACEMLVFGRVARGETLRHGKLRDAWQIESCGRLVWIDRLGLAGDIGGRLDGIGFGGARALATAIYVGPDAAAMFPEARRVADSEAGGATLVNGVLVARFLHSEPSRVRNALAQLLARLRPLGTLPWLQ